MPWNPGRTLIRFSPGTQAALSHQADAFGVDIKRVVAEGGQPGGATIALGAGWLWPAAFVAVFAWLIYLPAHHESRIPRDALVGAVGALYVIGLSVVVPRLVRGGILRLAGSREPIVLLGRGMDPLVMTAIPPRWRLGAIGAGALASTASAVGSAALAGIADPATDVHALVVLALVVNVAITAAIVVPIPGFTGWALLLALIDATRRPADQRIRRAARVAQTIGFPGFLLLGVGAGLVADPTMMLTGFLLALFTWTGAERACAHDALARFLTGHGVGEIARPLTSRAASDEPIDDVAARLRTDSGVVAVEAGGGVLGAIGPRQFALRSVLKGDVRCSDAMVSLGSLRLLRPQLPAADVLAEFDRHGFALVITPDGLGYVEPADLRRQVAIWVALGDRRAARRTTGRSAARPGS